MEESAPLTPENVLAALRRAGCVHAAEEAAILQDAAGSAAVLERMLEQRRQGMPLEHIVGWAEFHGQRITVRPGVFVPRKRSEYLVDQALAALAVPADAAHAGGALRRPVIVDLCCGTGALGAAMARALPQCELHAADIDPAAVACAAANIAPFGGRAHCGDLFAALPDRLRGHIDLIVANAPYVPTAAIDFMPREARLHEPDAALNGGADGLALHRRIAAEAPAWLTPAGVLVLECSERQAASSAGIMAAHGFVASVATNEDLDGVVVMARGRAAEGRQGHLNDGGTLWWGGGKPTYPKSAGCAKIGEQPAGRGGLQRKGHAMNSLFGQGAVVVGVLPEQDPAVLEQAGALAAALGAELVAAYVDPGSYLIEWDPDGDVLEKSLNRVLDPDDEAASAVLELGPLLADVAHQHQLLPSFHVLGGDPAMALGRLAEACHGAVIVVGARRPGLLAGVNEVLTGSVIRKLLATQSIPVLGIPRVDAHPPLHG